VTKRGITEALILTVGLAAAVTSGVVAWRVEGPYGERGDVDPRVRRSHDLTTGLEVIAFDSDGDLIFDTWSYMDGDRLVRMDIDDDEDGTIDRRKYFGANETVERVEFLDKTGRLIRTDWYSAGKVQRTESSGEGR
jgi:hypothetical protein